MASNTYRSLASPALVPWAENMGTVVGPTPATYGCTAAQVTTLNNATSDLVSALANLDAAKALYRSAVETKNAAHAATISAIADIAGEVYATETLSSAQIAATGLAVHDDGPSPSYPQEVTDVVATPYANATVKLQWNRGTNPPGTTFIIEKSTDNVNWTLVQLATRSKATLSNFAPGVPMWFRITASKNEVNATPSFPVAIYGATSSVELEIAA